MTLRPCPWRASLIVSALVLLLSGVTACDRQSDPPPSPSASSAQSLDEDIARSQVKAAFDGWYGVYANAVTTGKYRREDFARYATEEKVAAVVKDLKDLDELNVVYRGKPTWTAEVTSLNLDARPPSASLRVCLDLSKSTPVDRTTGENLRPKDELPRVLLIATATQADGRWLVADTTTQRTTPC
ncbi:hypothetical protein [Cryptosporangium sp. NPDC051539]|uniref:hypothetical protein n=1 Tax=Cryptosporangium sp. NPDC051539 TaxID=3363962 RepID=UPI0037B96F27